MAAYRQTTTLLDSLNSFEDLAEAKSIAFAEDWLSSSTQARAGSSERMETAYQWIEAAMATDEAGQLQSIITN